MHGDDVQDEELFAVTGRTRAVKARERSNWRIIGKIIRRTMSCCVGASLVAWRNGYRGYTAKRKDGMVDSYWEFGAWRIEDSFIVDLISPKLEQTSCLARLGCYFFSRCFHFPLWVLHRTSMGFLARSEVRGLVVQLTSHSEDVLVT